MTEFEQKLIKALIRVRDARNDPETVKSIVDKAIGAEEDVIPIKEPEVNAPSAEELAKGAFGDDHFGEGQAEGLDALLEGLKDTPHDDRW